MMPTPLESRLARLERESRLWRTVALLALLGVGAGLLQAQVPAPPDVVTARSFAAVDKDGKARVWMGVTDAGVPSMSILDPDGKTPRLTFAISGDGLPGLTFYDIGGTKQRAWLGVDAEGLPALVLYDRDGKSLRAWLGTSAEGAPGLAFYGKDGRTMRSGIGVLADDLPHVTVYDKDGAYREIMSVDANGNATMVLFDKKGKPIRKVW